MSTDLKDIKKLLALLDQYDNVGEITITHGDSSVTIKKNTAQTIVSTPTTMPASVISPLVTQQQPPPQDPPPIETTPPPTHDGEVIRSPMVGTCYLAPSPEAEVFVKVGEKIEEGQTLCLIEAMKMFNKIKSERSGILKSQLVENGQPVEFDQELFVVE